MSELSDEQISALLDGEVDDNARDFLLRRLSDDEQFRARWSRYHLIGEALRSNLPGTMDPDFAGRVRAAVAREPACEPVATAPRPATSRRWQRPAVGVAVAASLAAVALLGIDSSVDPDAGEPSALRDFQTASSTTSAPSRSTDNMTRLLQPYVRVHNGHAMGNPVRGHVPYVRLVGHDVSAR